MAGKRITDAQIERMALTIKLLAERGNAAAVGVNMALADKSLAQQRPLVLGFYATFFEILSCMQMAMNSERTPAEITAKANAQTKTEVTHDR